MTEHLFVVGVGFLAIGLSGAVKPYQVTRFLEQLDAIGSKTSWDEVEPADWNVTLTRFGGIFMTALGVAYLFA
ncbi:MULTISPECIES: hypothetical protein [Haloferax]|uniref:DUF6199 domain-containing protein n=2 Tax=Haloferax TaxID=2251 RepID=A0A6G1Z0H9_9EURY|nr:MULTISPECIES: hypothetical protein [Haloferax]KAB1187157.1 hypothetical protein Hfx1149_03565 [Haloferax sp. CBA1149]MRW79794.1 hypothetical protein [Haloferax marinisediminis]